MGRKPTYTESMVRVAGFFLPAEAVKAAEARAKRTGEAVTAVYRAWILEASGVRVAKQEPKA